MDCNEVTYDEVLEELSETFGLTKATIETILIDAAIDLMPYEDEVSPDELEEMYRAVEAFQF